MYAEINGYEFHGKENQQWSLEKFDSKYFYIVSRQSGLVLEIEGGIDADGMSIVQNKKYGHLNQLW